MGTVRPHLLDKSGVGAENAPGLAARPDVIPGHATKMDQNAIQGLLIGIGVPLFLIGVLLPIAILWGKAREVYDQIPEGIKLKHGIQTDPSALSGWDIVGFAAIMLLVVVPIDLLQPFQELVFGLILVAMWACLAVSSLVRAVHYGRLWARGKGELPVALIRYAGYSFFGMSVLFVAAAGAALAMWWAL